MKSHLLVTGAFPIVQEVLPHANEFKSVPYFFLCQIQGIRFYLRFLIHLELCLVQSERWELCFIIFAHSYPVWSATFGGDALFLPSFTVGLTVKDQVDVCMETYVRILDSIPLRHRPIFMPVLWWFVLFCFKALLCSIVWNLRWWYLQIFFLTLQDCLVILEHSCLI